MERIRNRPFVSNAEEPDFAAVQRWIEQCGRDATLPLNFCGGLVIMRLYRLIAPPSDQAPHWMTAVYDAAAAYDFAFLALGLADDEADMTHDREGKRTRIVTHPDTRAVDGINLLLTGMSAMQETLLAWPYPQAGDGQAVLPGPHPLASAVMEELLRALREASFPILLDRAGTGHTSNELLLPSGLASLRIDASSMRRVEAFAHHRAHTYLMRAASLASLLAGYASIDPDLKAMLQSLFRLWGSMGAAMDDLHDIFIDFGAGIHSICTVMAHLCVAEDATLRPSFRRELPLGLVADQRGRLAGLFGVTHAKLDRTALITLVSEIELRKALEEYFAEQAALLAATIGEAIRRFNFSAQFMSEIVAVVCRDPDFSLPDTYLTALTAVTDDSMRRLMDDYVGGLISQYILERYWPSQEKL